MNKKEDTTIQIAKENKTKRQCDNFLLTTQQTKMKELWENSEDETFKQA